MLEIDLPNLRQSKVCVLCNAEKAAGLIVCWDCYRKHELRRGNPTIEARLALEDKRLFSTAHSQPENL